MSIPANSQLARCLALIVMHIGSLMGASAVAGEWRLDRSTLDTRIDPCEDFYQYACGGFDVAANIPAGGESAQWLRDAVTRANRESLSQLLLGNDGTDDAEVRRLRVFFGACMNSAAHQDQDEATLRQWLQRIDREPLPLLLIELQSLGVNVFFQYSAEADPANPARYRGEIYWGDFGLRRRVFQAATPDAADQRAQYRARVARVLAASGIALEAAEAQAAAVLQLETQLAQSALAYQGADDSVRENPTMPSELPSSYPAIAWDAYLRRVGHPDGVVLNVVAPDYLRMVSNVLAHQSDDALRAYLRWSFLSSLGATVLPERLSVALGRAGQSTAAGSQRFDACFIETVKGLGVELSRQFSTRFVPEQSIAAGKQIVRQVQNELTKSLAAVTWLSPQARNEAREKIKLADLKIGYPATWPATGSFALREDALLENVLTARAYETARGWAQARNERRRDSWEIMVLPREAPGFAVARLAIPNGYPDPATNSIILPAASLRPPVLDASAPAEVLFGEFGTLVAHELIHSLDVHQYDALGNARETWKPEDVAAHERMFACVSGQAGKHAVLDGVYLDGPHTVYENVADYASVRHAYGALQATAGASLSQRGSDGLTREQRFFVAYAQSKCSADTPDSLRDTARNDGHATARFRVNAPLSNLPAFARTFSCAKKAPMVRPTGERCRAW